MYIKGALASIALALGLISSPAYSYILANGTDVGELDTFIGMESWTGNGGQEAETTWASEQASLFAGTEIVLTFSDKDEPATFQFVPNEDIVAFALSTEPTYFLVKDANKRVLFKNVPTTDWGVFNLFEYFPSKEGLQLSHLVEFSGDDIPVPEPGSLALLGVALTSLVALRRRKAV